MQDSTLWLMKQYRPLQERSCGISRLPPRSRRDSALLSY